MKSERFHDFVVGIHQLDNYIKSIEISVARNIGIKGVHALMIYSLYDLPEGLTASEIARKNGYNRSLVSREVNALCKEGIIRYNLKDGKTSKYNAKIILTEKGRDIAKSFSEIGISAQDQVRGDISMEDLAVFYSVLKRMVDTTAEAANFKEQ